MNEPYEGEGKLEQRQPVAKGGECECDSVRTLGPDDEEGKGRNLVIDGWCGVGSTVYCDFFIDYRKKPYKVAKVYRHPGTFCVNVDLDSGLKGINFKQWITRTPRGE